jgi:hypothetical protein
MNFKPTIELAANEISGTSRVQLAPRPNALAVPMPPQMTSVPVPATFSRPLTTWGAKRAAKYHRALTDLTIAQSGYLRSQAELSKSFVAAARAANEVAELPEICRSDTEIRQAYRERDYSRPSTLTTSFANLSY